MVGRWDGLVGIWPPELTPGAATPGAISRVGVGQSGLVLLTALGGGVNVLEPYFIFTITSRKRAPYQKAL